MKKKNIIKMEKKIKNLKLAIFAAVVLAVASLAGFGKARAANPPIAGVLRVNPDNPRYFTDDSEKAIYLAGWNSWGNLQDGFTNAYSYNWGDPFYGAYGGYGAYLDDLEANHLNYIRLWMYETPRVDYGLDKYLNYQETDYPDPLPWARTGPGNATDGGLKFDVTQFNQDYFNLLRERAQAAQNKGIYVSVMLFEGFSLYDADLNIDGYSYHSWKFHPFNPDNNINGIPDVTDAGGAGHKLHTKVTGILNLQEAYARKVIDTVNEFDNVLFEIANESANRFTGPDKQASKAWELHMVNYIKDYENGIISDYPAKPKKHPVGATSNTFIFDASKVDQDMMNSAVNPSEFISPMGNWQDSIFYSDPPLADGSKIIIAETDHFGTWDIRGGKDKLRPLLDGTVPQQLLRAKLWPWKSFTRGLHPSLLRKDPLIATGWDEAVRRMGQTRIYAEKMDLAFMIPINNDSCSNTNYCLANTGSEYLIYQPERDSFTVNLPAGNYNYEWFDPVTGLVVETGPVIDISLPFTPPIAISEDAVLYLKSDSTVSTRKVIRLGDSWQYKEGTSAPDPSWKGLSFTGTWPQGPTMIGRGVEAYATTISSVSLAALYARKSFTLSDTSNITSMRLYIGYDDGFVAYINGQEVARSANMPAGVPDYNTGTDGTSHEVTKKGTYDLTSNISALKNGDNVLAIEAHNKSKSTGDIGINPELEITSRVSEFTPADINSDNHVNIKDIQICIKAIVDPGSFTTPDQLNQLARCKAVAPPIDVVNIKDIQAIIQAIVDPGQ